MVKIKMLKIMLFTFIAISTTSLFAGAFVWPGGDGTTPPLWRNYYNSITLPSGVAEDGDQVAVIDTGNGNRIVGVYNVIAADLGTGSGTTLVFSNLQTGPGYTAGNTYSFQYWDASTDTTYTDCSNIGIIDFGGYNGTTFPGIDSEQSAFNLTFAALPTYAVTYDANSPTSGAAPADQTKTQGIDLTLQTNSGTLAKTGFTFAGWNTAADGSGTDYATGATYSVDAVLALFAKWTALPTYAVTYDANTATGGTSPSAQSKIQGIDLTLAANTGTLVKTGYTFAGWNTAADGSGTDYATGATYSVDAVLALFAKWTALPTYAVTYDANTATGGTSPSAQSKIQGIDLTLAANTGTLVKTGYTFAGWNTAADGSGTNYATGATYSVDAVLALFAKWTALPTYAVTYDANSPTSGAAPADQTKTQGIDLTLQTNSGTLAKTGFTFAGWNTAADGSGTDYAEGATYSVDAVLALFAKWTALPTYAVTYDANTATGGTSPSAQSKIQGIDLTLAANTGTLVKTGYTFAGWNTAADGSGTDYATGATYSVDAVLALIRKMDSTSNLCSNL